MIMVLAPDKKAQAAHAAELKKAEEEQAAALAGAEPTPDADTPVAPSPDADTPADSAPELAPEPETDTAD